MATPITCFKAYDIRGELNSQLTEDVAYRIGYAFAQELNAKTVVVGSDVRLTSTPLKLALSAGLIDAGATVTDIGMAGTEEIYFATKHLGVDGGIEVTASHNPINYNGMKLVKSGSVPISGDTGLNAIKEKAEALEDSFVSERLAHYTEGALIDADAFFNGTAHVKEDKLSETDKYAVEDFLPNLNGKNARKKPKPFLRRASFGGYSDGCNSSKLVTGDNRDSSILGVSSKDSGNINVEYHKFETVGSNGLKLNLPKRGYTHDKIRLLNPCKIRPLHDSSKKIQNWSSVDRRHSLPSVDPSLTSIHEDQGATLLLLSDLFCIFFVDEAILIDISCN